MKTERGIFLNINESNYSIELEGIQFFFSSEFYLNKFKKNCYKFVEIENAKINVKNQLTINLVRYFLIVYYKKVEKRGFRIYDKINNKEITEDVCFTDNLIY